MNILNQLTIKHLKMNKKRTIVTIIGVLLSTALMVGIGLLLSTLRDNVLQEIIATSGSQHVIIQNVPKSKQEFITQNEEVLSSYKKSSLGYAILTNGTNEYKPYLQVYATDDTYLNSLTLLYGRLPLNHDEIVISNHIESNGGVKYEIGQKITLDIGSRYYEDEEIPTTTNWYLDEEELKPKFMKEYTIVGIVKRDYREEYSDCGYSVFTTYNDQDVDTITFYIQYKHMKKTYDVTETLIKNIGFSNDENIQYNDALLALSGVSQYENITASLSFVLAIMLSLIAIGCIVVIYNSFAISVMERKKQFGLFSSIGATQKQLRKTVFFEAFIIGIIGIPLGILSAYIGIGTVLMIINHLLPSLLSTSLRLVTYPLFIVIPLIFMIITILASAFIPALRASKVTPIEAIRQNNDIKIKKRVKSKKWVLKLFGIEGDIAHKNMQRNKKKYRITTASLVISIVLFISFSSFMNYALIGGVDMLLLPDYTSMYYAGPDANLTYSSETLELFHHEQVDSYSTLKVYPFVFVKMDGDYTDKVKNIFGFSLENINSATVIVMSEEEYSNYLQKIGEKEVKPILYNRYQGIEYKGNERKVYDILKYQNVTHFSFCEDELNCLPEISDFYITDKDFLGYTNFSHNMSAVIFLPSHMVERYFSKDTPYSLVTFINAKKYDELDKSFKKLLDDNIIEGSYYNFKEELKMMNNIILVIKILVYGFITLVSLIGVTSVFNTISTSIALRRKEFAMLRSIGLTPKGFNKMIYFESLFVGLRALWIGIPISLGVLVLLHYSIVDVVSFSSILFPWKSIIITVLAVFIVIFISMQYSSKRLKKENILEAIREENI